MKRFVELFVLIGLLLPASAASAKVSVVTSLADYGAIAREVGAERVNVEVLAQHSVDPHYVDPRPNLILKLNKADLLVINGLGLEAAWLDPLVKQARNPKIAPGGTGHFVAADYAMLMDVPTGKIDRAEGDIHPGGNPHFYHDPMSVIPIANALRDRLSKLDPAGTETYAANAKRFTGALWKFAQQTAVRFAQLPAASRQVVSYHQSLGYLYRWLQLDEVATIEPKPGIPPNPKHVASVLGVMKAKHARVIVQEEFYPRKTSETLAKLGVGEVVVLPAASNFEGGEGYTDHLRKVAEALYVAISK